MATERGTYPHSILTGEQMDGLVVALPGTPADLALAIGQRKVDLYGDRILQVLNGAKVDEGIDREPRKSKLKLRRTSGAMSCGPECAVHDR